VRSVQNPNIQKPTTQPNLTPQNFNHGGHEIFDVHEALSGIINALDQYMMFRQYIKCQELLSILDRQYQFMSDQYNITVEAFTTGLEPSHPTRTYHMEQSNEVRYGLSPSQPKKPCQSVAEINEQRISAAMMGLMKTIASALTMAALEATNPVVRRVLADSVPNYIEMAYELFLYQNKRQFYQVPQLSQADMQQMLTSFAPAAGQPQMPQNKLM
jgi:spore coat protein CotF